MFENLHTTCLFQKKQLFLQSHSVDLCNVNRVLFFQGNRRKAVFKIGPFLGRFVNYSQFHKTLPTSSIKMHRISVRFSNWAILQESKASFYTDGRWHVTSNQYLDIYIYSPFHKTLPNPVYKCTGHR